MLTYVGLGLMAYLSGVGGGMIGSNYTDELKAKGLQTPGELLKQWDFTFGIGGPIVKDRLWYRVAARDEGQARRVDVVDVAKPRLQ